MYTVGMLVLAASLLFIIMAVLGCALDLSRMFLAQSTLQAEAESAALSAAMELDGTVMGVEKARIAAAGFQVEFSAARQGEFEAQPLHPEAARLVRLSASTKVPLSFVRVVVPGDARSVSAGATAEHLTDDAAVRAELVR
jgi:uncharacterized membrane protein